MKKIISFFLCALMLAAMFCMPASAANELAKGYDAAKDGELLYDVVFNAKDGVFAPDVFSKAKECTVQASADGKTVTLTHESGANGRYWWGGEIAGLEIGAGKSYTLRGKVQISGINSGVYINYPNDGKTIDNLYGFYGGRQDNNDMSLAKGGKKATGSVKKEDGSLLCDGSAYAKYDFKAAQAANADGFAEFAIVVEGYDFSVYFNGVLFDKHIGTADEFATSNKLGIAFYVYNKDAGIVAKDFKLYKGVKLGADSGSTGGTTGGSTGSPSTGDNRAVIVMIVAAVAIMGTGITFKAVRKDN